jgi:hypothetical protein
MSATTNTAVSPAFDRERAPDALSGLTIVPPCFDEAENVPDAVRLGPGPRLAAGTLRELADLCHALRDRRIPRVGV